MNYDPNEATSFRTVHVLEVTFSAWDYRATRTTEVGGNCAGFGNFESAIERIYDDLVPEKRGEASILLTNDAGDTCMVEDDEARGSQFLADMVTQVRCVELRKGGAS